jgi:elongation factor Ts
MSITPQMVKSLRDTTGAGMADCKKALEENNGDIEAAIDYLRKKGAASAAKRAEREAKEGAIVACTNEKGNEAVLAEINSETDFVAKNQGFVDFTKIVGEVLLLSGVDSVDELMKANHRGNALENIYNDVLAKFSEKIEIRRIKRLKAANENGYIETYIHMAGKLAVLVEVSCNKFGENGKALIKDIAMQIAAMNPIHIDKSDVTEETLAREKHIAIEQAVAEGKKPEIAERIAQGKVEKYFDDFCLMQQVFVKDNKKTVADVVAEIGKECGCDIKIVSFTRWQLGGTEA